MEAAPMEQPPTTAIPVEEPPPQQQQQDPAQPGPPAEQAAEAAATVAAAPLATPAAPVVVAPAAPAVAAAVTGDASARVPVTKSDGPVSNPLALRHERLQGTISKYVPTSGWGFVRSHFFEGEVGFKTESIMLECQDHEFKDGEAVEFDVQADERGRPQAVALKPLTGKKPADCVGERHRGYVRRFADRWGFLNAAAFDGDLFVHRDNLLLSPEQLQDGVPPLRAGQSVEFDVALDDRGRHVAKQITTSALLRPCEWIGRRLQGYIRSFQGAWGFINSDRFAGDLFVHRDSLMPQFQGLELTVGTLVEFDIERDHHKKGGKNRLVARQVGVIHTPNPMQAANPYAMGTYGMPQDPMAYGAPLPQYPLQNPYQSPYPYVDPYAPQPGMPPLYGQPGLTLPGAGLPPQPTPMPPAYGQLPGQPQLGQPQMAQPYVGQPQPYAQPQQYGTPAYTGQPMAGAPQPARDGAAVAVPQEASVGSGADVGQASGDQPQVLLHITTHDWEPDQSGQLRVRKGTLVNVSHRAAHGWVYAATVQPGGDVGEPVAEGWVPQAVVKRVSLCRVLVDWPAEGSGTLGLLKGDLIAVSREAERGWVYGERISPNRPDPSVDGWLPKKVLEYILT